MRRWVQALIVALALVLGLSTVTETQGPLWVLVNGALNYTGTIIIKGVLRQPNAVGLEYGGCSWITNVYTCGVTTNGGTGRNVKIMSGTNANVIFDIGGADYWQIANGNGGPGTLAVVNAGAPVAASAPTDSTAVDVGDVSRLRSSSTITPATAGVGNCGASFLAAALTADCTIATLPAGMKLTAIYADVTVGFTCSGTCSGTKVVQCGTAVNGTQVLAAALNVATTATYGLADADLGSGMTRAAAIQGGLIGSWSATTPISCRFTSGTGNWGNAAATFVNAGSIKFTLITEQIK